tara:strand:- start:375 stop:764 length:390 start_codon:yes stop_codon:yes gene_type:complete
LDNLFRLKFEDLKLDKPKHPARFPSIDWSEEVDDLIDNLASYEGSRIYGAAEMVARATCPECCGSSCMDSDYENGEDSCNGSHNHDCSGGEMSQASWSQLHKYETFQKQLKARMLERADDCHIMNRKYF